MKSCLGVLTCNPVTPDEGYCGGEKKPTDLKYESSRCTQSIFYVWKGPSKLLEVSIGYFIIIFRNTGQWIFVLIWHHVDRNSKGNSATTSVLQIGRRRIQVGLPWTFSPSWRFLCLPCTTTVKQLFFFFFYSLPLVYITLNEKDTHWTIPKSILLHPFHMFWRSSSEFKVLSSKHLSSFE